jgi:Putative transposase
VVYCKRPFGGPKEVLRNLARYTHRVAISNRRLLACNEKGVTFKWKDYRLEGRARYQVMTLATHEFIRRFLMHVPSHPLLWPARQRQARREHRVRPRTANAANNSR